MLGTHHTVIDAKNRINIPSKIRDDLGGRFFITVSLSDICLTVYLPDEYEELRKKIGAMPKTVTADIRRVLFGNACEREPDKQGRILIPQELREYAALTDDVVFIGTDSSAEIWSKSEYDRKMSSVSMESLKALAEKLEL